MDDVYIIIIGLTSQSDWYQWVNAIQTWINFVFSQAHAELYCSAQWRHNERDGVSYHRYYDSLLHRLFRRRWKKTSKLRVIKWKHFPRYWPFVPGIHRSPVNSPHNGQWHEALMFSLICAWMNGCAIVMFVIWDAIAPFMTSLLLSLGKGFIIDTQRYQINQCLMCYTWE